MPMMLSQEGWDRGKLTEATLSYGRLLDVAAPLVEVTTYLDGDDGLPSMEAEIVRRERQDAAILRQDWEEIADAEDRDEDAASRLTVSDEVLRHSRISVTMEIYTDATSEATREALRKLGESLGGDDEGRAQSVPPPSDP